MVILRRGFLPFHGTKEITVGTLSNTLSCIVMDSQFLSCAERAVKRKKALRKGDRETSSP